MNAKKKITQVDLARLLGFDRSSVSLALSHSDRISNETRRKVLEAARKYNYRPNMAARQLRSAKSNLLGLVIPDTFQALSEPVVVRTIQALASKAARQGMIFAIFSPAAFAEPEITGAATHLPDGLFVWGDMASDTLNSRIPDGHPVLVLDPNHLSYSKSALASVKPDNAGGAAAMVRHLLDCGAKRLLFVMVLEDHLGHAERWKGGREEWLRHKPGRSVSCTTLAQVTDQTLREFVAKPGGAIFCSSDGGAIELWRRLKEMGVMMPGDVKLAGFDDTPAARLIGLTSAVFDCERLAEAALTQMLKMVAGKKTSGASPLVPVSIHQGTTT